MTGIRLNRISNNINLNNCSFNHNRGFIASDGTHTNNAEGFSSYLKDSVHNENEVKRVNIYDWLQFLFKRCYLVHCSLEEVHVIFIKILKN